MNYVEQYDLLIEYGIATEDELHLIQDIYGMTDEAITDILYARTGYRTFEQFFEEY